MGKNIPSKEKLNRTFLFVVKLLFFIIRDAAFGHNRPDVEGGFNSWKRTHALGKEFELNSFLVKSLVKPLYIMTQMIKKGLY